MIEDQTLQISFEKKFPKLGDEILSHQFYSQKINFVFTGKILSKFLKVEFPIIKIKSRIYHLDENI